MNCMKITLEKVIGALVALAVALALMMALHPILSGPPPPQASPLVPATTAARAEAIPFLVQERQALTAAVTQAKVSTPAPSPTVTATQAPPAPDPPPAQAPDAGSGGVLTPAQVGAYWLEAGGPASQETMAECVAWHESGDNPDENNYDDNYGTQTSWGLFQVSNGTHDEWIANLDDPLVNAEVAVAKYEGEGDSWLPDWPTAYDCM
jgi:hypothetical protein